MEKINLLNFNIIPRVLNFKYQSIESIMNANCFVFHKYYVNVFKD